MTPALARGTASIRFTLSRGAKVVLRIETTSGVIVRTLPAAALSAGPQAVVWDGHLPHGTKAYGGVYVAHIFATTASGTSDLAGQFAFRRA